MTEQLSHLEMIPLAKVLPNPEQPRKEFDQEELTALANSIQEDGILNPIAVSGPYETGGQVTYTLIDGERRLRAAKLAALEVIPALVHAPKANDKNLILAMVGNLQRSNLNPIEEAMAYKRMKELGMTYIEIARAVGVVYQVVIQRVSLLNFDPVIQQLYAERKLPQGANVVAALNQLPETVRVRTALRFAMNHTTAKRIEAICQRIAMNAARSAGGIKRRFHKNEIPCLQLSTLTDSPLLTALKNAGMLPGWEVIRAAAQETCDDCSIRSEASAQMCQDCPAIILLKKVDKASRAV